MRTLLAVALVAAAASTASAGPYLGLGIGTAASPKADWQGNGWLFGAGFEYRFKISTVGASAFVDYQYASTNLVDQRSTNTERGMGVGLWTLGATVSL